MPDALSARATDILARLIAFDTTSRQSNLELIAFVEMTLADLGIRATRVANADGSKANLYATIGNAIEGGVVLSGHTDVVPVDGQSWSSAPFELTKRNGRLYGRGTCDMKGFLALALAAAPLFTQRSGRPVHLAFSYDEEVGCLGAPLLIDEIIKRVPTPHAVIVGEPTSMEVVTGHKGMSTWKVSVTGHEAHSSLTHRGISANMIALQLMRALQDIATRLECEPDPDSSFMPPHATLTIGKIQGGTAINILAGHCEFFFDFRWPPGVDPERCLAPFMREVEATNQQMRMRFPGTGIVIQRLSQTQSLASQPDNAAEALARRLTGYNGPARAVSYVAEAGQFQRAGLPTILCGPGSIEQAHQPDEYLEIEQLERGAAFMLRLEEALRD